MQRQSAISRYYIIIIQSPALAIKIVVVLLSFDYFYQSVNNKVPNLGTLITMQPHFVKSFV